MFDVMGISLFSQRTTANFSAILIVFVFVACLAFCWYQWKIMRAYSGFPSKSLYFDWALRIITGRYPKGVPLTRFVFQDMLKTMNSFRENGLAALWIVFWPKVVVCNEKLMKHLVNEVDLGDKGHVYDLNKPIFGNGLLGSNHDVWKVHRKLLNPAFSLFRMKSSIPSLNKYASQLGEKIDTIVDKPTEDIFDILKWASMQSMFDCVLGVKKENEKFQNLCNDIMKMVDLGAPLFVEKIFQPWLYSDFLFPFFEFGKKYLNAVDNIDQCMREVMNELEEENLTEGSEGIRSGGRIITELHLKYRIFSNKDVRDHLLNFIAAGYDTIAVTMMWCLYILGHHPEIQERAYSEVASIVPEGDPTYDDLTEMRYLECVLKETMRLYSTVPFITRKARRDIVCGQYIIPKGAEVVFFIFMMHRDPNIFPEPEKFDPERFSDNSNIRPWMYIPFSEGYRSCIGKRFAMLEMKIQLSHLLRRFKIKSLNKIDDSDLECATVLKPSKPPRLLFENRHSTS